MMNPLDIFKSQFTTGKLEEPNAPHDPFCIKADEHIFYCEGYRELTTEELRHLDFPYRFGELKAKEYTSSYCGGYEVVREEPITYKDKVIMLVQKWIYDFER